jgi:hypothetical protein
MWWLAGWSVLWRRLYPQVPSGLPWEWTRATMVINCLKHDASNTLRSTYDVRLLETPITSCCFEHLCYSVLSVKINPTILWQFKRILCFVARASCVSLWKINQLDALNFSIYLFIYYSLHVSGTMCPSSGEIEITPTQPLHKCRGWCNFDLSWWWAHSARNM